MKKDLVFAKEGNLFLDTCMTESAFAKSGIAQKLSEKKGLLAKHSAGVWLFSPWTFSETKNGKESVLLCGKAFYGKSLRANIEEQDDAAKSARSSALVCTVMEEAKRQKCKLPYVGAEGIFLAEDEESIVFLPEDFFNSACQCSNFHARYQGFYVNPKLSGKRAISYTQAVIAYRALCQTLPFEAEDEAKREEDILDGNFIHIKNKIFALNESLSDFIDSALLATKEDKKSVKKDFPLSDFYNELGLTDKGLIPIGGKLLPVISKSNISPEEFEKQAKKTQGLFFLKLKCKRWFRKNRVLVGVCAGLFLALAIGVLIGFKNFGDKPTTRGLTAFQTTEAFYSSYNNLDINSASSCVTGKKLSGLVDVIGQLYVSAKARSAYNPKAQTVTPAEWLNFNQKGNYYIWGLTQFAINSDKGELFVTQQLVKDKPPAVTEEGGVRLKGNEKKNFTVSYNLVHSELSEGAEGNSIATLVIEEYQDQVTLVFEKEQWKLSSIESMKLSEKQVSQDSFYADFTHLLEKHSDNLLLAANELRQKYPWISDNSEILSAKEKIQQRGIW